MDPFEVLAEPHRRALLDLLRERERSVSERVGGLRLSQPGVSRPLRVLREAQLVDVRIDGQRRIYSLRAAPLGAVDAWIAPYRRFWVDRFDALERHLNEHESQK